MHFSTTKHERYKEHTILPNIKPHFVCQNYKAKCLQYLEHINLAVVWNVVTKKFLQKLKHLASKLLCSTKNFPLV